MKKTIGILGGMGPLATADLYRKIVESTAAEGDSGHIRVFIDSNTAIPDRTAAILSGGPDPVPEMLSALRNLEKCGADCIIMPCNTAHYFLPRLRTQTVLPILDMPAITAQRCAELFPGKRACVLATKGTLRSGVYSRALERAAGDFQLFQYGDAVAGNAAVADQEGRAGKPRQPRTDKPGRLLVGALGLAGTHEGFIVSAAIVHGELLFFLLGSVCGGLVAVEAFARGDAEPALVDVVFLQHPLALLQQRGVAFRQAVAGHRLELAQHL